MPDRIDAFRDIDVRSLFVAYIYETHLVDQVKQQWSTRNCLSRVSVCPGSAILMAL